MEKEVEQAFKQCQVWYENRNWKSKQTGKTTSLGDFLSHRAPARASDMAIYHPEIVEHRSVGRFKVYRLRTENKEAIQDFLASNQPAQINQS